MWSGYQRNPKTGEQSGFAKVVYGRPCRSRTCDTLIKSHGDIFPIFRVLSKLESARKLFNFKTIRLTLVEKSG